MEFGAEVATAGLFAGERVEAHHDAEIEEVSHTASAFEFRSEGVAGADDLHVLPEVLAEGLEVADRPFEASLVAGHAALLPGDFTEGLVVITGRLRAVDRKELRDAVVDVFDDGLEFRCILRRTAAGLLAGEEIRDRVGQDEITVGETLHERGGSEAVGAVVGEVSFAADEEAGDIRL